MSESILEPGDPGYNPDAARHAGRYYGVWRAKVKAIGDPEERGRIRVYIPALFSGRETREDQWTDWVMPKTSMGSESSNGSGAIVVPPVGATVWIEFEQGHHDFPVYSGGFFTKTGQKAPQLARGEDDSSNQALRSSGPAEVPATTAGSSTYPYNRMIQTPAGHAIEVDDSEGKTRIRIKHQSGSQIEMQHDGSIVIHGGAVAIAGDSLDVVVEGDANVGVTGNAVVTADGQIKLGSNSIVAPVQGVVNGEAIDTLTGSTMAALGNASTKVAAFKV